MEMLMIGFILGSGLGLISLNSYKNILVMKAEDGSSEYIKGKFYRITEEGEYYGRGESGDL